MAAKEYAFKFFAIIGGFMLSNVLRNYLISRLTLSQSCRLHQHMLENVLHSHATFYEDNPAGRVLSRFTKDIAVVDTVLPVLATWFALFFFRVVGVFVLLCFAIPWLAIPVFMVSVLSLYLRQRCLKVLRRAMKLDALSKGPILSQISATLAGLPSLRRRKKPFLNKFYKALDTNSRAFLTATLLARAFQFFMDLLCAILVIVTVAVSLSLRGTDPVLLAMVIQIVNDLMGTFQTALRMSVDLENSMTSLNRCLDYTDLPAEEANPSSGYSVRFGSDP